MTLALSYRLLDELVPYARNARTHSPEQVAQLAASIEEFGFAAPILADAQGIVAGHGRVLAARKLYELGRPIRLPSGETLEPGHVPVVDCQGWSEAQRRAYILADNKLALNAEWDEHALALELADLQDNDFDMSVVGFSEQEIAHLLAPSGTIGLTDPDAAPPLPERVVTQTGDVWLLDRHRLICGDATRAEDVQALLGECRPHLMVTDPPYGVDYEPGWRNEDERANGQKIGARAIGKVLNDNRADWREAWALFPGEVAYVWHATWYIGETLGSLLACNFNIRAHIIWAKNHFLLSRGHYHWQHEPCWYAVRKDGTGHWNGDRTQSTVWQIDKPVISETGHSTQKPVECMQRPIENNSLRGEAVYDPFVGSGTTIIAAESTGRTCYAMEVSPAYCDVTVQRWQDFTGKQAIREQDGLAFDVA